MPRMDGISVLKKLRKSTWGRKIPVIMLTNLSYVEPDVAKLENLAEYLVKSDWKIADVVKKILQKLQ